MPLQPLAQADTPSVATSSTTDTDADATAAALAALNKTTNPHDDHSISVNASEIDPSTIDPRVSNAGSHLKTTDDAAAANADSNDLNANVNDTDAGSVNAALPAENGEDNDDDDDDFRSAAGTPPSQAERNNDTSIHHNNNDNNNNSGSNNSNGSDDISHFNIYAANLLKASAVFYNSSENAPVRFCLPPEEQGRNSLKALVERYGGKVVDDGSGYLISRHYYETRSSLKPAYILDCIKHGALLPFDNYRVRPEDNNDSNSTVVAAAAAAAAAAAIDKSNNGTDNNISALSNNNNNNNNSEIGNGDDSHHHGITDAEMAMTLARVESPTTIININKNGFTEAEDEFILEEVRKNPRRRATHKLFHEIAAKMDRHTGNSVRYRFRNHLQKDLRYVYKTDTNNDLLTDQNGNYIITAAMPLTVKTKFTAMDDYVLCKAINQHRKVLFGTKTNKMEKKISLTNKFFEMMEKDEPQHSRAAWRDRFRKFASHYGIDNYIQYYEDCIRESTEPQPMKNYTARARLEAMDGAKKLKRTIGASSSALRNNGNKNNDNSNGGVNNNHSSSRYDGIDTGNMNLSELIGDSGNPVGSINNVSASQNKNKRQKTNATSTGNSTHNTNTNSSNNNNNNNNSSSSSSNSNYANHNNDLDSANLFLAGDDSRSDLQSLPDIENNLDSPQTFASLSTNPSQIPLINKQSQSSLAISELLEPHILSKFFSKEYFHLSLSKILNKANEIVSRDYLTTGADLLLDSLHNELGINKNFGTEILTNCCGDLSLVSKYINLVINTGKNPPENVSGIWTRDDDARLSRMQVSKEDKAYLMAKHGEERIDLRKQFINSI